jgi:hypothetical protein
MIKQVYPKCAQTFKQWYLSNMNYNILHFYLGIPRPFDVTLRDGLQALSKSEQDSFTLRDKINLYHRIKDKYNPQDMEIGSIVSDKVLPIFKDTLDLHYSVSNAQKQTDAEKQTEYPNNYIVVPNKEKLQVVVNNVNITHFSFITSISNSFQLKNTKMSLEQSDKDISNMISLLYTNPYRKLVPTIKLYVSCINECPIEGKIDNDVIVNRILNLHKMNINKICLSDTCGTLEPDDFEYIVDTCHYFGLPMSKFSLHLHVKPERETIVEQIIHMALDRKIKDFDVSLLESGGCSVTMGKKQLAPNLSYDLYYKSLTRYIIKKSNVYNI